MPDTVWEIAGVIAFACFAVLASLRGFADLRRAWKPDIGGRQVFLSRLLPLWLVATAGFVVAAYGDTSDKTALLVTGAIVFTAALIPFVFLVWKVTRRLQATRKD